MKKTLILAAGFAMMACGAVAQETSVPKRITYYRRQVFMLSTPNGTKGRRDKDAGAFDQRGAT